MDKKPGLAILIGHALAKKGKAQHDPMPEGDGEDGGAGYDESELKDHLKEIASELIDAVKSEDANAVADLLQEAFECLDASPHEEGPHEDGEY
jgi:hypothetical protein